MTEYASVNEAAGLLGLSPQRVRWMCRQGKLPDAVKRADCWEIPQSAHPKLAPPAGVGAGSSELPELPARKRDKAMRRLGIVQEFERFAGHWRRAGRTRGETISIFCKTHSGTSPRSLHRWINRFHREGLEGLVDARGGGKFPGDMINGEAFEYFKALYLTQQRLSVKQCRQMTLFESKDKRLGWKMPSLRAMYRYVTDRIPLPALVLHREGLAAYEARCAPYIETDLDQVEPGSVWIGDHSPLNCWIRHRGRWVRPWITAWMDMRSRAIVGWDINASPNQTTIMLAAKRGLEKYGPPDSVKIDNGKDYDSEMWTGTTKVRRRMLNAGYLDERMTAGLYAMLDVTVSFAIKYHPQSKAVERLFDTMDRQFTKTLPTYCGKNTDQKPDYINDMLKSDKAIKEAYSLESFAAMAGKYIDVYNNSAHSGRGMDGQTPLLVLSQRTSRRVMAAGVLELLMRVWSGELIVGKNGVRFKRMWYGQYDLDLLAHQGEKVRVAYDPDDLSKVWVYDVATMRLLCLAEQARLVGYGAAVSEENLREAMRQKSRALKLTRSYRDSRLVANADLTDLAIKAMQDAAEQPPAEAAASATLRPVRTAFDRQVREHKRQEVVKHVKRAAGAESMTEVLDVDLSLLRKESNVDLELFDGDF